MFFFVAALLVRLLQTANTLSIENAFINALGPVYFHMFLVGWVTQLVFGIVYWMFPKFSLDQPRRSERLGWWVFWLLNIGLGLRVIAEPLNSTQPATAWGWLLVLSAVLQWLAGMGFVVNSWGRVKAK
jgi:cbb3-type cytochrome oxidase subunit 1